MPIRLLGDRVLVRPDAPETQSAGGIIMAKPTEQLRGTVIFVGPGQYNNSGDFVKNTVQIGDTVIYAKNVGEKVTVDDEELLMLHEGHIMGIIT